MAIAKTHFDMKYKRPRTGSEDEKKYTQSVKNDLAEILEAPTTLTDLKGDDRKWLLMCIAALRYELHSWCRT
jgi:hypothetical protein